MRRYPAMAEGLDVDALFQSIGSAARGAAEIEWRWFLAATLQSGAAGKAAGTGEEEAAAPAQGGDGGDGGAEGGIM